MQAVAQHEVVEACVAVGGASSVLKVRKGG
jgi:hypothetical protein